MEVTPWHQIKIEPDSETVKRLEEQRIASGSPLGALDRWNISEFIGREISEGSPATFDEMMPLWVGKSALLPASQDRKRQYAEYVESVIGENRYTSLVDDLAADRGELTEADLSPPHDFLLVDHFIRQMDKPRRRLHILEVGGGYGRLAEVFLREMEKPFTFILSDAVPESIHYSYAYLRSRCPTATIHPAFDDQPLPNLGTVDILVLPAWRIPELEAGSIDVAINIASVQEMPDRTVDAYFAEFPRIMRKGGIFFFENSREYAFRWEYTFPANWRYLLKQRSPRSRTLHYPVDVLQVRGRDQMDANARIERCYYQSLSQAAVDEVKSLKNAMAEERTRSKDVIAKLNERNSRLLDQIASLRERLATKNVAIDKLSEAKRRLQERSQRQAEVISRWRNSKKTS